jgi:hypothetical protein
MLQSGKKLSVRFEAERLDSGVGCLPLYVRSPDLPGSTTVRLEAQVTVYNEKVHIPIGPAQIWPRSTL